MSSCTNSLPEPRSLIRAELSGLRADAAPRCTADTARNSGGTIQCASKDHNCSCIPSAPARLCLLVFAASWYYVDALPFVFLAVGLMLERMRPVSPMVARNFGIYLLLIAPTLAAAETYRVRQIYEPCREAYDDVEKLRSSGRLLIFADDKVTNGLSEMTLECLWVYNTRGINGDVVVARDLDAMNSELISRYPGYRALRVRWDETQRRNVFTNAQP